MSSEQTTRSQNPLTVLLTSSGSVFVLRIFFGAMFLYSSIDKIQSPEQFAIAIRGYQLLPLELTNLFAITVAWAEAVAGILLLLGIFTRKAAAAVFILLVSFTIAIGTTIARGIAIDCGCFSNEGGSQTNYTLVIRNLFLIAGTLIVTRFDRGFWSLGGLFSKRSAND